MQYLTWVKSGDTGTEEDFKIKADGTFFSDKVAPCGDGVIVTAAAYDSSGEIVTGTVGTITISSSPMEGQFHEGATMGSNVISLTDAGPEATYGMPLYRGPVTQIKAVVADVDFVGEVDHIKIKLWVD